MPPLMLIDEFRGPYRFLSNFYPCIVSFEDEYYPSTEHAFQAAKTIFPDARQLIRTATSAALAKRLGRTVVLRPGWNAMRVEVMRGLLIQKFKTPDLRGKLLSTGNAQLVEGNTWGDVFWGVCNGVGENQLGKLLMQVREGLRSL